MTDAEYLKAIRKQLGLSQSEMAERLGYTSHANVSRIETEDRNMSNQVKAHLKTIEKHEIHGHIESTKD